MLLSFIIFLCRANIYFNACLLGDTRACVGPCCLVVRRFCRFPVLFLLLIVFYLCGCVFHLLLLVLLFFFSGVSGFSIGSPLISFFIAFFRSFKFRVEVSN